jgi:hypothetical protein
MRTLKFRLFPPAFVFAFLWSLPILAAELHPAEETDPVKAAQQGWTPAMPAGAAWNTYLIMPWQLGGPRGTDALTDKDEYRRVHLRAFHIDHGGSERNREQLRFAVENNWPFYLDHACGKGILHMHGEPRKELQDRQRATKDLLPRPECLADPAVIQKLKDIMTPRLKAMKAGPLVAIAFDDEISLGSFNTPLELDSAPASIAAYRVWLRREYQDDIAALNRQYGTDFAGFETVMPIPYEKARTTLAADALGRVNLSHWVDWRSYMDTQLSECLRQLTVYANEIAPGIPAGFVGAQQASAWAGYDYAKLRKAIQFIEAYDIGGTNELLRSFWPQTRQRMQTWFGGARASAESMEWALWHYLCHGNRGAIMWPEGMFGEKDGVRQVVPVLEKLADSIKEVQSELSQKIINGRFQHDPIAIYYSHPSIIANWALDSHVHGGTWPNRQSSVDNRTSTSGLTRVAWVKLLEDLGYQGKFTAAEDVVAGVLLKEKYKVLVLPRVLCLADAEVAAIREFAAAGGLVIADHLCGIFDGRGKTRGGQGALVELFGVRHDLSRGVFAGECLTEVNAEKKYNGVDPFNLEHGLSLLRKEDVLKPVELAALIAREGATEAASPAKRVWSLLSVDEKTQVGLAAAGKTEPPTEEENKAQGRFLAALNRLLSRRDFYDPAFFNKLKPSETGMKLIATEADALWKREVERRNRLLLEASFSGHFVPVADKPRAGHGCGMALCERGLVATDGEAVGKDEWTGAPFGIRKGNALYLNLSLISYLHQRDDPDGAKLRALLKAHLAAAGLRPRCTFEINGQPVAQGLEAIFWDNNGVTTLCVLSNFLHAATISSFSVDVGNEKTLNVKIKFAEPVKGLKNERTGEALGDGDAFSFAFTPSQAGVLTFRR